MIKKEIYETEEFKSLSAFLLHHQIKHERVGSSLIQGVTPGDYDILVMENDHGAVYEYLTKKGWAEGGSKVPDSAFRSFKNVSQYEALVKKVPHANVILTDKEDFYDKFSQSNAICVEAQLKNKYDRIKVYDYMFNRKGKPTDDEFSGLVRGESLGYSETWGTPF
jgi:hypothetical protein|tara:strand:+ start:216 stop:710 length:495 start_codon:yes stop_codon:yes gene_type:complete